MSETVFAYGPLGDENVRLRLFGNASAGAAPASLPGFALVAEDGWPAPRLRRAGTQAVAGALIADTTERQAAALAAVMGPGREMTVDTASGPRPARVFGREGDGAPWDAAAWGEAARPVFLEMLAEALEMGKTGMSAGLLRRAVARLAADRPTPDGLRSDFGPGALDWQQRTRLHARFFALDLHRYRQRRFDGGYSPVVEREVFCTGDSVTVLPWDPASDRVLLIELMRAGPAGRGDPNPLSLEIVAGMRDRVESAEDTARREAREEAGLELGRLARIGGYYPSPGAMTEFVTSFIGEADLSGHSEGIHGLDAEHEDIRTLIVPRARAMAALESGEVRNAPLMVSLYELERRRDALLASWR